jgi:hypothetical protein
MDCRCFDQIVGESPFHGGRERSLDSPTTQNFVKVVERLFGAAVTSAEFGLSLPAIVAQPPFSMIDRWSHEDTCY